MLDEEAETFSVMMGLPSQSIVGIDSNTRIVSVTIDDDDNSKPTVTIITLPSPASVLGRGVVTLDGASSDSTEDTLTYIWTTTPANIGEFGDTMMEDTTWTAPAPLTEVQTVTLVLTVTDNGTPQEQDTATAIVTVEANKGPLAEAYASGDIVQGDGMMSHLPAVGLTLSKAPSPIHGQVTEPSITPMSRTPHGLLLQPTTGSGPSP